MKPSCKKWSQFNSTQFNSIRYVLVQLDTDFCHVLNTFYHFPFHITINHFYNVSGIFRGSFWTVSALVIRYVCFILLSTDSECIIVELDLLKGSSGLTQFPCCAGSADSVSCDGANALVCFVVVFFALIWILCTYSIRCMARHLLSYKCRLGIIYWFVRHFISIHWGNDIFNVKTAFLFILVNLYKPKCFQPVGMTTSPGCTRFWNFSPFLKRKKKYSL